MSQQIGCLCVRFATSSVAVSPRPRQNVVRHESIGEIGSDERFLSRGRNLIVERSGCPVLPLNLNLRALSGLSEGTVEHRVSGP